ncbi:heme o synthase [soil metagenome]
MRQLSLYYAVIKPERTLANVMTTAAGFLLASAGAIDGVRLVATIAGTSLIVASACAVNNATDRSVDSKMPRTQHRALVTKDVSLGSVVLLALVFGIAGFVLLISYVNRLTAIVGAIGYIDYVLLYAWAKRHTVQSTLVGTISGAAPIVAGYVAVTNHFDATAVLLGLAMVFWQMAHFFAIAVYREKDYRAARLPVFAVIRGSALTKRQIMLYIVLFAASLPLLVVVGDLSTIVLIVLLPLTIRWLWLGFSPALTDMQWGRQMFGSSLVVLLLFCGLLAFGTVLP